MLDTAHSIEEDGREANASVGCKAEVKVAKGLSVAVDSRCYVYTRAC